MTVYVTDIPVRLMRRHGSGDVAGSVKNAILKLETDAGIVGWGDAAPWAVFTGTVEANAAALHVYLRPLLVGAVADTYFATVLTPAVGIVVKPWSNVSIYGNYIEALNPGPTAPTTAVNAGEVFAPTPSKQIEIGAKVDFGQWSATTALFQITEPSGITDPATNIFSVDGKQVNRGIELNVFGQPMNGARMLGGLMLLDGQLTQTAGGTFNGNKAVGVPDVTIKLGVEWDTPFVRNLTLAGRVNYFGSQFIDEANTQSLSAYTLVGIGARYRFEVDRKPLAIRANIENLLNESAWASAFIGGLIYRGAPRTFYLSLAADF